MPGFPGYDKSHRMGLGFVDERLRLDHDTIDKRIHPFVQTLHVDFSSLQDDRKVDDVP